MPTWAMHLATATKLKDILHIETNSFLFGNLLPDINNGYVTNVTKVFSHSQTHYNICQNFNGQKEILPNINGFISKYHAIYNNPLLLGYLTHILADFYWNYTTYVDHGFLDKEKNRIGICCNNGTLKRCDKETARKLKTNDFKIFSNYIYGNQLTEIPFYQESLLLNCNTIPEVDLTKKDIENVIQYLTNSYHFANDNFNDSEKKAYVIYTEEELLHRLEDSIHFILQSLTEHSIL